MALIRTILVGIVLFAAFAETAFAADIPIDPTEELPRCPPGRVYKECGNCENTCPDVCLFPCEPGCYCSTGMIDVDGVCVDKDTYCGGPLCPRGRVYFAGCICLPGEIEIDGACVNLGSYCNDLQCTGNSVYKDCGQTCKNYCPNLNVQCLKCAPGCYCDDGYYLDPNNNNGICYPENEVCV